MTALGLIQQIESLGGTLAIDGDRIRALLTPEAETLVPELQRTRDEVFRILLERDHPAVCPVHGTSATWWNRQDGSAVCGLCHPDPFALAAKESAESGPPPMPDGVTLFSWEPKEPPIELNAVSIVTETRAFILSTLRELDAALRGDCWGSGNWSVRDLCERLEQVGVDIEVAEQKGRMP